MSFQLPQSSAARTRYARSAEPHARRAPAPLTFEEWLYLVPEMAPPPEMISHLQRYRAAIEGMLPQFTAVIMRNPAKLKAAGFQIPDRFTARGEPSKEEIIRAGIQLYRSMLDSRYAGA